MNDGEVLLNQEDFRSVAQEWDMTVHLWGRGWKLLTHIYGWTNYPDVYYFARMQKEFPPVCEYEDARLDFRKLPDPTIRAGIEIERELGDLTLSSLGRFVLAADKNPALLGKKNGSGTLDFLNLVVDARSPGR
jgi:hypothetical protein